MKLNVETPERLVDVNRLPLDQIERLPDGGLKIGATVRNSDLAHHPVVEKEYAVLSQAILAGASTQLRNRATTAGNLLQRTRCVYFRDPAMPCNKREPGSGCPAIEGHNRNLAILGTSPHCIASNPSDMCVAMAALEAVIHVRGAKGERAIPIADFHLLPGATPERETVLEPGDLITHVTLPPQRGGGEIALSQAARPRFLRVRARLRGSGPQRRRREDRPRAARARRRGCEAVASARGRGGAGRPGARRGGVSPRGGARLARSQTADAKTASKSSWRGVASSRR